MKLGEVIVTYNSDDANMQTITIVNSRQINTCSNKTVEKTAILVRLFSNKPHCNTTMGK